MNLQLRRKGNSFVGGWNSHAPWWIEVGFHERRQGLGVERYVLAGSGFGGKGRLVPTQTELED